MLLVEKSQLTSGSTCHAAGLVTQFNPSPTMMRFRRYSVDLYEELGVFYGPGSLRIASSPESLVELERGASRARGIGLDVHVLLAGGGAGTDAAGQAARICTGRSGWNERRLRRSPQRHATRWLTPPVDSACRSPPTRS